MRVTGFLALFLALTACVFAQAQFEDKLIIDPFTVTSPTIILLIPTGGLSYYDTTDSITNSNFVSDSHILGVERDLYLTVDSGEQNLVLTTGVSGGLYTSATPNQARGSSNIAYDGVDGTDTIFVDGLFGDPDNDFTVGDAFAFRTKIQTDQPTTIIFEVYSGQVNSHCQFDLDVPGDDVLHEYFLNFDDFVNVGSGCDWTNVGALIVTSIMFDNVDVLITPISLYGPVETCFCTCPVFSCLLRYDPDDDTYSYYVTSDFGVFNPTTDFSTNGNPPPNPSQTQTPRPSGASASPRPGSDSTTLTLTNPSTGISTRNSNSRNSNSANTSSDASVLSIGVAALLLVALLF
jgi:hypothetical protein